MVDSPTSSSRLLLSGEHHAQMVQHCLRAYPLEGCGLLIGELVSGLVTRCVPTPNIAESSRLYIVDPRELLRADRAAEASGWAIIGVFHSHTHTDPYPSPTDVAQAPDPNWHYVLISLRAELASTRSYRIVSGKVQEEPIEPPP